MPTTAWSSTCKPTSGCSRRAGGKRPWGVRERTGGPDPKNVPLGSRVVAQKREKFWGSGGCGALLRRVQPTRPWAARERTGGPDPKNFPLGSRVVSQKVNFWRQGNKGR